MLKSRSRIVWVTLAVGTLMMLGSGGALAAGTRATSPRGGDAPSNGTPVPLCESAPALAGTTLCPPLSPRQ